ncbi:hypothetical protein BDZ91DRAFT_757786 [Kalaharituber pfeilii]|nr:hypothetical protein BDZ91DRAFT_757786 [Kalaharituber pfeilii]
MCALLIIQTWGNQKSPSGRHRYRSPRPTSTELKTAGWLWGVFSHNPVHLATPDEHPLAVMYGRAREMGMLHLHPHLAIEMSSEQTKLPLLVHGILRQAIDILSLPPHPNPSSPAPTAFSLGCAWEVEKEGLEKDEEGGLVVVGGGLEKTMELVQRGGVVSLSREAVGVEGGDVEGLGNLGMRCIGSGGWNAVVQGNK